MSGPDLAVPLQDIDFDAFADAPPTVADQIIAAIVDALKRVYGIRSIDIEPVGDPEVFPSAAIYETGWTVVEREAGLTRRLLTVTVEGYVQRGDGAQASGSRNAFHAACVREIMSDDTLGGLVEEIDDGDLRKDAATLAEARRLMFAQDFAIQFLTSRVDPAQPA